MRTELLHGIVGYLIPFGLLTKSLERCTSPVRRVRMSAIRSRDQDHFWQGDNSQEGGVLPMTIDPFCPCHYYRCAVRLGV